MFSEQPLTLRTLVTTVNTVLVPVDRSYTVILTDVETTVLMADVVG